MRTPSSASSTPSAMAARPSRKMPGDAVYFDPSPPCPADCPPLALGSSALCERAFSAPLVRASGHARPRVASPRRRLGSSPREKRLCVQVREPSHSSNSVTPSEVPPPPSSRPSPRSASPHATIRAPPRGLSRRPRRREEWRGGSRKHHFESYFGIPVIAPPNNPCIVGS
jgi:hypothetical protein